TAIEEIGWQATDPGPGFSRRHIKNCTLYNGLVMPNLPTARSAEETSKESAKRREPTLTKAIFHLTSLTFEFALSTICSGISCITLNSRNELLSKWNFNINEWEARTWPPSILMGAYNIARTPGQQRMWPTKMDDTAQIRRCTEVAFKRFPKKMPNTKDKRFNIAMYMKERKEARFKAVLNHRSLALEHKKSERIPAKIVKAKEKTAALTSDLENNMMILLIKENRLALNRASQLFTCTGFLQFYYLTTIGLPVLLIYCLPVQFNYFGLVILARNKNSRKATLIFTKYKSYMKVACHIWHATKRRQETMTAVSAIHGASKKNLKPAYDGMFDTLQKRCKMKDLTNYVLGNENLTKTVVSEHYKKELKDFEKSKENAEKSIATFYSSGVMGKRKYQSVRLVVSMTSRKQGGRTGISILPGCKVPKILTYNNLARELNKIDIGSVLEINNEYLSDLEIDAPINGAYRDLREYLPRLAKFYLNTDRKHALEWYGKTEGIFLIALGGHGCPFGEHESACSFLVSFLNVGANCDETSQVVKIYVRSLVHQIAELDKKIFQIDDWVTITFKVQELPNDMKMLAMLAGELVISSKYFSPFANVCKDDATDLQASFGPEPGNKWQPWEYKQRVNVVGKVKAGCLCKKVKRWFDGTQESGPDLQYRFTGKESRRFCHNYMSLVNALSDDNDTKADRQAILVFAYLGQRLRDSVSFINRFDIKEEELAQFTLAAQEYLRYGYQNM
ncbi:Hypothetical predicted protein, partial [Paramuricea clavata]